jgi:hypothetical protein
LTLAHGVKALLNRVNGGIAAFSRRAGLADPPAYTAPLTARMGRSMVPVMFTALNVFFGICREIIRS